MWSPDASHQTTDGHSKVISDCPTGWGVPLTAIASSHREEREVSTLAMRIGPGQVEARGRELRIVKEMTISWWVNG